MRPYPHQEELSDVAVEILRRHLIVYLACEERTGKTLIAIRTAEKTAAQRILVITKKKALEGWHDTFTKYQSEKTFDVINWHQAHKKDIQSYDLVILDESHNYISAFPKVGGIQRNLRPLMANKPLIYVSATPHAQGLPMLFHQFQLSSWSPWKKYKNFYQWFRVYGKVYQIRINGMPANQYDRCHKEKILADVQHLFVTKTRAELGFEHEPVDKLHFVELSDWTKALYNELVTHEIADINGDWLVCDTSAKLRASLHMLEGGVAKIDERFIVLQNEEKLQYALDTFGDNGDTVIMYNYRAELLKLQAVFKKNLLLQATSFAEGVDLSDYDNLVIYSQDFSTARHTQRRARQCNKLRTKPIVVHYLLVKKGLSQQVYKTVTVNKKNFVDSVFERNTL